MAPNTHCNALQPRTPRHEQHSNIRRLQDPKCTSCVYARDQTPAGREQQPAAQERWQRCRPQSVSLESMRYQTCTARRTAAVAVAAAGAATAAAALAAATASATVAETALLRICHNNARQQEKHSSLAHDKMDNVACFSGAGRRQAPPKRDCQS